MSGARCVLMSFARALVRRRAVVSGLVVVVALGLVPVVLAASGGGGSVGRDAAVHRGLVGRGRFDRGRPVTLSAAAGSALPGGRELVGRRTASSRTFEMGDGRFVTRVYPWAVNYRDAGGRWQPIDDTLVAGGGRGYAYVTRADGDRVSLPGSLEGAPIRVEAGGAWVAIRLDGGRGAVRAAGTSASIVGALPGVDASYGVSHGAVKERLRLSGAGAPATFGYTLDLSPGLAARGGVGGGVEIVDRSGRVRFRLPAPFAFDAAGARIDAGDAISLRLVGGGSRLRATVAVDRAWLRAAGRRFPVTIDPGVDASDSQDCYVESGASANTSFCGGQSLQVGYDGTNDYRALLEFNVQAAIPASSVVSGANMAVYRTAETNPSNSASVGAYAVTRSWTSGATWNKYDGTNLWTTAGGDFQSTAAYSMTLGSSVGEWNAWSVSGLAQSWLDGTTANNGVLLKETTENVNNVYTFASKAQSNAPYLQVDWEPKGMGIQSWYPMVRQKLTDRSSLGVNAANGNLVVHSTDLQVAGTGIPFSIERTYNNLNPDLNQMGFGWSVNSGGDMWIDEYNDAATFFDSTYTPFRFTKSGTDGSGNTTFSAPAGIDAKLVKAASDNSYTLTYNVSGVKLHFAAGDPDDLQSITDRNGHSVQFSYNTSEPDQVSSALDTQSRTTTVGYHTGPTNACINQLTDSSSRVESYTYYPDSSWACGMQKTFTDGAGRTTTYSYDANDNLTQIQNPAGDITQIGYDSSHRVTSIKRVTNNTTMAGDTTTFTYNAGYTVVADPLYSGGTPTPGAAHTTTLYYNTQGQRTKVVDGKGNTETTAWTNDNQISTDTSPKNQSTGQTLQNTWDPTTNVMTKQVAPNTSGNGASAGATATWSYNSSGPHPFLPDSMTNPSSSTYSFSYDSTNNNLTQISGQGPAVQASYDYNHLSYAPAAKCMTTTDSGPIGTVRCSKDGNGNETYYTYDTAGNLTKISPPPGGSPTAPRGTTQLGYDGVSRVTSVTDGLNQLTSYHYDGDDRLTEIDYADATKVTYSYDGDGNLTQRFDSGSGGGTSSYTYDLKNRLTQRQDPYGTSTYGYDAADNLLSLNDAGGTVSYGYDAANMLCYAYVGSSTSGCSTPPSGATTFSEDADGNRSATNYPGSVTMSQTYDNADRLTEIKALRGSTKLTDFLYTYVLAANDKDVRQTVTDASSNKTTYTYDTLDRLQEAQTKNSGGSVTFDRSYAYDGASNLCWTYNGSQTTPTCASPPSSGVTSYKYGSDNQLCWSVSGSSSNLCGSPPTGATTFSYDGNGMETNDSAEGSSTFNDRGQYTTWRGVSPETYIGPDQTERTVNGVDSYKYNQLGLGERTHSGAVNYYTRDPSGTLLNDRTAGNTYNYILDGLGSIVALTDSTGNIVNSYTYDPQGNTLGTPTENVDNPFRYASGLWSPSTGTLKYGERYYDPTIDRWTQPDPIDQNGIRLGNDYLYVGDDPVNHADPSGQLCIPITSVFAGSVCGGYEQHVGRIVRTAAEAYCFGRGLRGLGSQVRTIIRGGRLIRITPVGVATAAACAAYQYAGRVSSIFR